MNFPYLVKNIQCRILIHLAKPTAISYVILSRLLSPLVDFILACVITRSRTVKSIGVDDRRTVVEGGPRPIGLHGDESTFREERTKSKVDGDRNVLVHVSTVGDQVDQLTGNTETNRFGS